VIEIVGFEPGMAEAVTACYNEAIEPVPDCHPVPVERFATLEALATSRLRDEAIGVAREDGRVAGFMHVGIVAPTEDHDAPPGEPAAIRFLAYAAGKREAGRRLLVWAEDFARERERGKIIAHHYYARYPFYHCPWGQLSVRMAHIGALLGMHGYEDAGDSELYFNWRDFEPPQPEKPDVEVTLEPRWVDGQMGSRLELRAMRGEEALGRCNVDRGQTSPSAEAKDWCYCYWLGIRDAYQGKGLGRFLLVSALHEMKRAGCRHAAISTTWNNYRAALFYTNLGFRFADQTHSFRKEL
jgi:GNAT superfamily N-acetyltransferase